MLGERQITFSIPGAVHAKLAEAGAGSGIATGRYARMLFEAGYTARFDRPIQVPEWVVQAGLEETFRDVANRADEFVAASECRRIKASRGRQSGNVKKAG